MRKWIYIISALVLAAGAVWFMAFKRGEEKRPVYQTAAIERGPLVSTVSSTGTLNAVVTVQVGSQVSGQIKELSADFNSEVKAGQDIARLDPQRFEAQVRQAEAELAVARANVAIQKSAVEKARVVLADARRTFDRNQALLRRGSVAQSQLDEAEAALAQARANLKMAEDQVEYAQAQVRLREASLLAARIDLDHTIIRSPVDGTVISRSVDVGQTVAASLQAPTLFTIAQDLRRMQVEVNLDEADIGAIRPDQRVTFTVDAFPGREFSGRVIQIRKAAQVVQNVVTYTVIVSAQNPDLSLLPGMTATVKILAAERPEAVKLPNAALRFRPASAAETTSAKPGGGTWLETLSRQLELTPEQKTRLEEVMTQIKARLAAAKAQGLIDPGRTASSESTSIRLQRLAEVLRKTFLPTLTPAQRDRFESLVKAWASGSAGSGRVWVLDEKNRPVPVDVMIGITDGAFTELLGDSLQPGQKVVVGESGPTRKPPAPSPRGFPF